jgi:hypothetical protein
MPTKGHTSGRNSVSSDQKRAEKSASDSRRTGSLGEAATQVCVRLALHQKKPHTRKGAEKEWTDRTDGERRP